MLYEVGQFRRDRSEVTRLGVSAALIAQYRPPEPLTGRDHTPLATPDAAKAAAAVWIVVTALASTVPLAVYCALVMGARNVLPATLRPRWMTPVRHTVLAPVPAANARAPPLAFTVAPPEPTHVPVRAPVLSSISSPVLGMVQLSPVGNRPLMAVKNVTQSETFGDAGP